MTDNIYILFLISRGLIDGSRVPYISFVEKNYDAAKLYFSAFIQAERKSEKILNQQPVYYVLHQMGEITKKFVFKPKFCYISDSYRVLNNSNEKIEVSQLSIMCAEKVSADMRLWAQSRSQTDQIKALFEGKVVND